MLPKHGHSSTLACHVDFSDFGVGDGMESGMTFDWLFGLINIFQKSHLNIV